MNVPENDCRHDFNTSYETIRTEILLGDIKEKSKTYQRWAGARARTGWQRHVVSSGRF